MKKFVVWAQDDALPEEDTLDKAGRKMFGDDVWKEIAVLPKEDRGDCFTSTFKVEVDHSFPGACGINALLPDGVSGAVVSDDIKRMDLTEFKEKGYLREVNRRFLHPLGLALEVMQEDDGTIHSIGGIWDYRDDPEGMLFSDEAVNADDAVKCAQRIDKEVEDKMLVRNRKFGCVGGIQPVGTSNVDDK